MARELVKNIKETPDELAVVNNAVNQVNLDLNRIEKKGLLNIVQKFVPASSSITGTTGRTGALVTSLTTSITTTANNSKICYDLTLGFEMHHDNCFFIQRVIGGTITEIGSHNAVSAGARLYGFVTPTYDNDVATTLDQKGFKIIDSPNVVAGTTITYQIRFYGTAAHILYLNRVASSAADDIAYERCSSCVVITEYGE